MVLGNIEYILETQETLPEDVAPPMPLPIPPRLSPRTRVAEVRKNNLEVGLELVSDPNRGYPIDQFLASCKRTRDDAWFDLIQYED